MHYWWPLGACSVPINTFLVSYNFKVLLVRPVTDYSRISPNRLRCDDFLHIKQSRFSFLPWLIWSDWLIDWLIDIDFCSFRSKLQQCIYWLWWQATVSILPSYVWLRVTTYNKRRWWWWWLHMSSQTVQVDLISTVRPAKSVIRQKFLSGLWLSETLLKCLCNQTA